MEKSYSIRVSSQRGGVGKTTISVNLAVALGMLNYKVLLVDTDFESPAVGNFLGLESVNIGIADVAKGKATFQKTIIRHNVSGINVLPGTLMQNGGPSELKLKAVLKKIMSLKDYDFIIVDTQPGQASHELAELYDEALIVTTPTMTSIGNSIKLASIYNKEHVIHDMVVNRTTSKQYELNNSEIEEGYGNRPIISLPEDPKVPLSEAQHIPVWILSPSSPFCQSLRVLVKFYASKKGGTIDREPGEGSGIRAAILRFVRKILGFG